MEQEPLFADRRKALKQPIKTTTMNKYSSYKHIFHDPVDQVLQKQNQQPQSPTMLYKNIGIMKFGQNSQNKLRYKTTTNLFEDTDKIQDDAKKSLNISYSIDNLLERIQSLKEQFNENNYFSQKNTVSTPISLPTTPIKSKDYQDSIQQIQKYRNLEKNKKNSQNEKPMKAAKMSKYQYQKSIELFPLIETPVKFRQKTQSLYEIFPKLNIKQQLPTKLGMNEFQLGRKIGEGKYGDVFICRHKKTQSIYALKKIMKSTIKQYNMVNQFTNQLKINYLLVHPNIIKLYGHFQDEYHVFLLLQYAQGGSLMKYLKKTEKFVATTIQQVLLALKFMHEKNVSHRDLKPENIVVFFNNSIKICDFGWSKLFDNEMKMSRTLCGTPDYISPQMKDHGIYGVSVDLWSVGVLAFELLAGYPPFQNQIKQWLKNGIKLSYKWVWNNIVYPSIIKDQCKDFISSLLRQNPGQRMTIDQCFNHTFILKNRSKMACPITSQK